MFLHLYVFFFFLKEKEGNEKRLWSEFKRCPFPFCPPPLSTETASTLLSVSISPPWDGGSPRCAKGKTACVSSWHCITCTIISACPMPAYARRCRCRSRRTGRARPGRGGPKRRRWRLG